MITRDDAVLALSNSGEAAELNDIVAYTRRFGIPLISMTGTEENSLARSADIRLVLPPAPEACPMGLAPTTSTTMMIALGDALAVALMERRGFSADQYRDFHPGGALGKKLVRVSDIMHKGEELPLVAPETPMRDVLMTMTSARFGIAGYAGVIDKKGALIGIITDGDLRRHMERGLLDKQASDVMTANPKTVSPDILASEALTFMNAKPPKVTYLFVVDPKAELRKPVGFLSVHDILRAGLS